MSSIHALFLIVFGIIALNMVTHSRAVPVAGSTMQDEGNDLEIEQLSSVSGGMSIMFQVALNSLCTEGMSECVDFTEKVRINKFIYTLH